MSVFGHGQLRLFLLRLLQNGPRHGYDLIRELERRFAGMYSPSAGTVYPRLAKLEQEGLVARIDEGRKALYRLTDAGRAEVERRASEIADLEATIQESAERLAEQMRRRVRAGAEDLRAQVDDEPRPRGRDTVDVEGLLSGLTGGLLNDPDALLRTVRGWAGGETAGARTETSAPGPAWSGATTSDAKRDASPESTPPSTGSQTTHDAASGSGAAGAQGPAEDPATGPDETDGTRNGGDGIPSAEQLKEVVAILAEAGDRIRTVLQRPRQ